MTPIGAVSLEFGLNFETVGLMALSFEGQQLHHVIYGFKISNHPDNATPRTLIDFFPLIIKGGLFYSVVYFPSVEMF